MTADAPDPARTVYHLADQHFVGPNTDLPVPPADLGYADYDTWARRELLIVNGVEPNELGIAGVLESGSGILLAAAAHCAQAWPNLTPTLRRIMVGDDEDAAVEAAYALARHGDDAGRVALREAMAMPIRASLSAVRSAGLLARLGDLTGERVIRTGLDSEFLATRMVSCKELFFFRDAPGWPDLVAKALADVDPTVQREVLLQLRSQRSPSILPAVAAYLDHVTDPDLAARAREIVA